MPRFVEMFRFDPVGEPTARIRIDYDPDFGNAILSDENVHVEQVENPDARHVSVIASLQLTAPMVRWMAETMTRLAVLMEENNQKIQQELDRLNDNA